MEESGKEKDLSIRVQREDIFDTRKPRDNFDIGEIIEEKASLFMVFNLGSAFSALPYNGVKRLSITRWSPAQINPRLSI